MHLTPDQFAALKPGDTVYMRKPAFPEHILTTIDRFIVAYKVVDRKTSLSAGTSLDREDVLIRENPESPITSYPRLMLFATYQDAAYEAIQVLDYHAEEIAKLRLQILKRTWEG